MRFITYIVNSIAVFATINYDEYIMKKILLALLLVLSVPFALAQTPQNPTPTLPLNEGTWQAIKQYCIKPTQLGPESDHTVKLDGSIGLPNTPYELWRFTDGDNKWMCAQDSTGTPVCNNLGQDQAFEGFKIRSATKDQLVSNVTGEVHLANVFSWTKTEMNHYFFALAPVTAETTQEGDNWSLKLAQIVPTTTDLTNCGRVTWDPEGTVFDATTLEPLPSANVTLLKSDRTPYPVSPEVRQNPYITSDSGHYSFFAPDGTYFLQATKNSYRLATEAEKAQLQQRLLAIQQSTGKPLYYNLYISDTEPIIQKGMVEHRDIPMVATDPSVTQTRPPKILGAAILKANAVEQLISGSTNIPLATMDVYQGLLRVGTSQADQFGIFSIIVKNDDIDSSRPLELFARKPTEIYGIGSQETNVSQSVKLFAVPSFIHGVVYQNKVPVPNATVSIATPDMNRTFVTVKADDKGLVTISPAYIPTTPFVLVVKGTGGQSTTTSTQDFITQNQSYFQDSEVNIFDPSTLPEDVEVSEILPFSAGSSASVFPTAGASVSPPQQTGTDTKASLGTQFSAFIITLLLALVFGAVYFFVSRRKNRL